MKNKGKESKENFEETIERLKKLNGKIRGSCIRTMIDHLLQSKEKESFSLIQQRVKEYGFGQDLSKISAIKWYPVAFIIAIVFSFYEVLNWEESDLKEAGKRCPRSSAQFIFRVSSEHFLFFAERAFKMASFFWRRLVNFGDVEAIELNKEKKYTTFRIKDFPIHPLYCKFISGFVEGIGVFIIKAEKFYCEETKCPFKGDPYHEFILRWE